MKPVTFFFFFLAIPSWLTDNCLAIGCDAPYTMQSLGTLRLIAQHNFLPPKKYNTMLANCTLSCCDAGANVTQRNALPGKKTGVMAGSKDIPLLHTQPVFNKPSSYSKKRLS